MRPCYYTAWGWLVSLTLLALRSGAHADWDGFLVTCRPVPLVKEIEAEACARAEKVVEDAQANGGQGGRAVSLAPGGPGLTAELDLKPGIYAVFTIARAGQGKFGVDLLELEVKEHATGQTRSWTMVVAYCDMYRAVGQMYFPAYAGGAYTVKVLRPDKVKTLPTARGFREQFFDEKAMTLKIPREALWVDRLEVRDALGNCARKAMKTRRMVTTDEELPKIRKEFAEGTIKVSQVDRDSLLRTTGGAAPAGSEQERKARGDWLWGMAPDFNEHMDSDDHGEDSYGWLMGRTGRGFAVESADLYEKTGRPDVAWDAAVALCALAEKFPAMDSYVQDNGHGSNIVQVVRNTPPFRFNILHAKYGRNFGIEHLAIAYDRVFDFIKGNDELAAFVSTRIPWVKTPDDVVALLDVNLLQAGFDAACRYSAEVLDMTKVVVPLVLGPGPESDAMLARGAFRAWVWVWRGPAKTFLGGVDDYSFCAFNPDGVHNALPYASFSEQVMDAANYLRRYVAAGGSPRYDLYAVNPEIANWTAYIDEKYFCGGFTPAKSPFQEFKTESVVEFKYGQTLRGPSRGRGHYGMMRTLTGSFPSRVLGTYGMSILESGQFQPDWLKMRGATVAMAPGLPLEAAAHGCLTVLDLNNRYWAQMEALAGENRIAGAPTPTAREKSPKAPWRHMHNAVEVDGRVPAGRATNDALAVMSGVQVMGHSLQPPPQATTSLYHRLTALVDVGDEDGYVLDVARVRGGATRTYCFHGVPGKFAANVKLQRIEGSPVNAYFNDHVEKSRAEGPVPPVVQFDWTMTPDLQDIYQQRKELGISQTYRDKPVPAEQRPGLPPVVTRLSMLGQEKSNVLVGKWSSDWYKYDFWNVFVQAGEDGAGRGNAFAGVIESFAGEPFLRGKRLVSVEPAQAGAEAPLGVEIQTAGKRTDLAYASITPTTAATLDGTVKVAGKFALVSRDAAGLCQATLVGGRELSAHDFSLKPLRPRYEADIVGADYAQRSVTVQGASPPALKGSWMQIQTPHDVYAVRVTDVRPDGQNTRIRCDKRSQVYRSDIVTVDAARAGVSGAMYPFVSLARSVAGMTVTNERQDRFWKVRALEPDGDWMNMGFPGYRGSWPNKASLADFPDASGDGRRTARLYAKDLSLDAKALAKAEPVMEIEVLRVDKDNETIHFKLPARVPDKRYREEFDGWAYLGMPMVNEDGTRVWRASFPGRTFLWKLDGACKDSDFTDADGDGRRLMSAFLFGPGDRVGLDTHVNVRRKGAGVYEVEANVGCELGLPRGEFTRAEISADGKTFAPIAAQAEGACLLITLAEKDLGDGKVALRLAR